MIGLIEEGQETIEKGEEKEPLAADLALIAAAQRVEHYEIASYGTLRTWANLLGKDAAASLLEETLDEEKDADVKLTSIAESAVGSSTIVSLNYFGAQAVLYPHRPTPEGVFEVIARFRPTLFFGVPTLYAGMLAVKDAEKRFDTSSLRLCVSAGEALPDELFTRWRERFSVEIIDGIGTTEIGYIFISNRPGRSRPGSSGVPVPGYELAIVDDEGHPVARGEIGNLRVKGDSTMAYYWNKHDKTKETLFGSWIQTGDKYYEDADGYFWYCGRSDDMLKVGGIWVSPVEVEATLVRHPAVLEAAVVGREDSDRLVKPQAFVVLKEPASGGDTLADELKAFVKDKIAPYKYPRWIDFVAELPKTATGKIQRFKLRA